jgi:hypothetical protein
MYGCQLRRDQNGRWNIIEAGDGEVLGNAELMGHHPDGQTIARGRIAVGRGSLLKMPSADRAAVLITTQLERYDRDVQGL